MQKKEIEIGRTVALIVSWKWMFSGTRTFQTILYIPDDPDCHTLHDLVHTVLLAGTGKVFIQQRVNAETG